MTQAMVLIEDDVVKTEDLILNISIEVLAKYMVEDKSTWYNEVLHFLKKVAIYIFVVKTHLYL